MSWNRHKNSLVWNTRARLFHKTNNKGDDILAVQGAGVTAAILLIKFAWNISAYAPEGSTTRLLENDNAPQPTEHIIGYPWLGLLVWNCNSSHQTIFGSYIWPMVKTIWDKCAKYQNVAQQEYMSRQFHRT